MPQLHMYVPAEVAERIRTRARERGVPVSKFLADLVTRDAASDWPEGFFQDVVGGWKGAPLERAEQGAYERRESLSEQAED